MKDFVIIDNFFNDDLLSELNQYCISTPTDILPESAAEYWKNVTPDTKKVTQEELTVNSRLILSDYLFNTPTTPLFNNKLIKKCKAGIYKIIKGGILHEHEDDCLISLTVYLSKDWNSEDGGNFYYINSEGEKIIVKNCFNTAILFISDEDNLEYNKNNTHGFTEITGDRIRYTLQLFVK